jgi:hypothetical protein
MGAQRFIEWVEDYRAGPNLVGQRRQAGFDTPAGISLALAVDRSMCWPYFSNRTIATAWGRPSHGPRRETAPAPGRCSRSPDVNF